jgi:hypothetical protein
MMKKGSEFNIYANANGMEIMESLELPGVISSASLERRERIIKKFENCFN